MNLGTDARVIWEHSSESDGDQCLVFQTRMRGKYLAINWHRGMLGESDLSIAKGLLDRVQTRLWEEVNNKSNT